MVQEFYEDLYKAEGTIGIEVVLSHVPWKVTNEMNVSLNCYTAKEVKVTLFQMYSTKAPTLMDFYHNFQKHWHLCNNTITKILIRILNGDDSREEIKQDLHCIDL
jgi:hypothetical protein